MKDHIKLIAALLLGILGASCVGTMGVKETVTWQDIGQKRAIIQSDAEQANTLKIMATTPQANTLVAN